ncbi:MCE family protein [Williamsia sterculiae]|uniref:Phospholipid/cholesterol/gamma-HCH transport system substrate-binding protein n=1 Tax=Williamsia sterculiae TaxID=1344003 RepID=A0A1N7CSN7_9NOCA|nr:MCE family protein [Williamsia sterculiae]SIR66593.1 phospholipid/cholesterol/gamma-HCH transport system substrate-binding protein [Williamsia sterculiae]
MRITRFVRIQLIIFAVVTVISMVAMALFYVQLPAFLGIGRYAVYVDLPSTGGLYRNANVAYRGVDVGKVQSVTLTATGVRATLSVDSDTKIPASSQATVRSVSAIGEQYVEFAPRTGTSAGAQGGNLRDGSTIHDGQVPTEISSLLDQADRLLDRVSDTKLRQVLDESFQAFNGSAPDLQRLLDSLSLFVDEANNNSDRTVDLIEQAAPLLRTQSTTADQIRSWTSNVATFTNQLRANDPELVDVLDKGPGVANQSENLFASMNQSLPLLFDNLGTTARTLAIYHPNLQQVIVLYPRLMAALITALNTEDNRNGANVDFSLGFQDPGTCTVGFLPFSQRRPASEQTPRDLPPGLLCRVPQDSNVAVRGSRNFPCMEVPGRRAPTPAECRSGYVSQGQNVPFPQGLPGVPGLPTQNSPAPTTGTTTRATPSSYDGSPAVYAAEYDPRTGEYIGPDGKTYNAGLGSDGRASGGGDGTWQSLITTTVGR